MRNNRRRAAPLLLCILATWFWGLSQGYAAEDVCKNETLREVFQIIHGACNNENCDESKLDEINSTIAKPKLLTAMRTLPTIHVFFPSGKATMKDALDLGTAKKDQLAILQEIITNPEDTVVYVVGRGSAHGSARANWEIARKRTLAVYYYLLQELKLTCRYVQKVAFGKTVLQLTSSDAGFLGIAPNDFRNDEKVLNQSVEIFVYPCRNRLPTVTW